MKSVWQDECSLSNGVSLDKNIDTDVLIIGAGIAGILTGYMLKSEGVNCTIIDAGRICEGNTGRTTAKITLQHELIYNKLIREYGENKARQYAEANKKAIDKYKEIIKKKNIQCEFKELPNYLYTVDNVEALVQEYEAELKLGIEAELLDNIELPVSVKKALKINNQAQFNPLMFLKEIAKELTIYENTRAVEIKNNIVTTDKYIIAAKAIVIATHYPIINFPGYYFMRMHQERSYVIALENAQNINGMYIGIDEEGYSFREYKNLLLLGGGSHRCGDNEVGGRYEELRKVAKRIYPEAKEVYNWSAQDCMPADDIPFIGQYSKETPNLYVATGFKKWGMTTAMVSAMIITDMIKGRKSEYAEIFSPKRFDISDSMANIMKDGVEAIKGLTSQFFHIPDAELKDIKAGHGGIIEYKGEKVGVYKDEHGKNHIVSTKCPHLGCEVKWNPDELSWDCPCHGSRFDYKGNWIESPAQRGLNDE